jgi:hypothetical protein
LLDQLQFNLKNLLKNPLVKSHDWQKETGRLTGQAHNALLKAGTEKNECLKLLVLINMAQRVGCKEAKKIKVSVGIFHDGLGDAFRMPSDPSELLEVLRILSKIRAEWCLTYIRDQVSEVAFDRGSYDLIQKWTVLNSSSYIDWIQTIFEPIITSEIDPKTKLLVIKLLEKSLLSFTPKPDKSSVVEAIELQTLFARVLSSSRLESSVFSQCLRFVVTITHTLRLRIPGLVAEPAFLMGVTQLSKNIQNANARKYFNENVAEIFLSAANLVCFDVARFGSSAYSLYQDFIRVISSAAPELKLTLDQLAKRDPYVIGVLKDIDKDRLKNSDADQLTLVSVLFARVCSVDRASDLSAPDQDALSHDIKSLARALGISCLDPIGSEVAFDPIVHTELKESDGTVNRVRIVKPAIIHRRSDSTYRVIQRAIVEGI